MTPGEDEKDPSISIAPGKYHIVCVDESNLIGVANYLSYIVDVFREKEGMSIVFSQEILEEMKYMSSSVAIGPFAMLIFNDPPCTDLLLKISKVLADNDVDAKVSCAYHHTYLLVPDKKKEDTLRVLKQLF